LLHAWLTTSTMPASSPYTALLKVLMLEQILGKTTT
jgi:hypothetical protein